MGCETLWIFILSENQSWPHPTVKSLGVHGFKRTDSPPRLVGIYQHIRGEAAISTTSLDAAIGTIGRMDVNG